MRARRQGLHERVMGGLLDELLPDLTGRRVVDLGCGDGWLARIALAREAASVVGIDPSERMLALARARTPGARFVHAFAEDAELRAASADVVVSVLALHYIADVAPVLRSVAGWLVPGGALVVVVEHPFATAVKARPDRAALAETATQSAIGDRYQEEGMLRERWFTDGVIRYHRRLGTWLNELAAAGLYVVRVAEPRPGGLAPDERGLATRTPVLAIVARVPH